MVKLTIAPTVAKTIVLKTSADGIFEAILKNVPPTVPIKV